MPWDGSWAPGTSEGPASVERHRGCSGWARWTGVEGTPKPDPLLPATALRTALDFSGCPRIPYKLGQPESGVPIRGVPSNNNLALVIRGLPGPTWAFESPKDLASHLSSGRPGGLWEQYSITVLL